METHIARLWIVTVNYLRQEATLLATNRKPISSTFGSQFVFCHDIRRAYSVHLVTRMDRGWKGYNNQINPN